MTGTNTSFEKKYFHKDEFQSIEISFLHMCNAHTLHANKP